MTGLTHVERWGLLMFVLGWIAGYVSAVLTWVIL